MNLIKISGQLTKKLQNKINKKMIFVKFHRMIFYFVMELSAINHVKAEIRLKIQKELTMQEENYFLSIFTF